MCNKKKKTISLPSPGAKSIKVDKPDLANSFSLFYCKLVNYCNSRIISPQNNKHHSSRFRGNFRNSVFQRNKFFSWKKIAWWRRCQPRLDEFLFLPRFVKNKPLCYKFFLMEKNTNWRIEKIQNWWKMMMFEKLFGCGCGGLRCCLNVQFAP